MKILRLKISKSCYSISESLNVKGLLWKHKWFVMGKYGFEELVTFERSGVLHIISGDEEEKASWNYNIKNRSLALRHLKVKITRALRPFFWDGCLLIFKLNSVDEYLFLVNVDKAHKLETNPLDSFETYAQNFIQKKATDKRRKKVDEKAKPEAMPVKDDPKTLLAKTPGPVAQNFEPEPEPEPALPVVVEPLPEVVPLSEVEDRVRQGLEEQKKMLEKELRKKFEEEKDKLSAALWVEKRGVEQRIQEALKQQAWHLEVQTRNRLKEQRKLLKEDEQKSRGRWMQKVKLEVSMLKKKTASDRERIQENEEAKYKRQLAEELKKMRNMYESQISRAKLKEQTLTAELEILNSSQQTDGEPEDIYTQKLSKYQKLIEDSALYRRKLEKDVEDANRKFKALQKRYCADIEAEKKKCQNELKRAENAVIQQRVHIQRIYETFETEWCFHQARADYEIDNRLKALRKKDSVHNLYSWRRNILIGFIALAVVFHFFNDLIFDTLQYLMRGTDFYINYDYWRISIPIVGFLMVAALFALYIILINDIIDRRLLKEKVRQDYDKKLFMKLLGIKESEKEKAVPSAAPETPSQPATLRSKLGKWFRTLRRPLR